MTYSHPNVLIDTNVLIDMADSAREHHASAEALLDLIAQDRISAFVSPTSLNDLYYILVRTYHDEALARAFVQTLLNCLTVCTVDQNTCATAAYSNEPDFEDALVRTCAEQANVECIVSRDQKAFEQSYIKRLDAEGFVARVAL